MRWKTRENMSNSPSENGFFWADCWRLMFVWKGNILSKVSESLLPLVETSCTHKPLPRFFICIMNSLTCLEKTCFQQAGSSTVEGTSQAALGSCDQRKVPASLSLFLKREKIPAQFYVGKGPSIGPSVIWDLCLRPVLMALVTADVTEHGWVQGSTKLKNF